MPLSTLIIGSVLTLVVVTAAAVGWTGFLGARRSVDELWRELADSIASRTTSETLRLIEDAEPQAQLSAELVASDVLDIDDPDAFLEYLTRTAEAYPSFTWVYYGHAADGRFLGVFRASSDAPLQRRVRTQLGPDRTEQIDLMEEDGAWVEVARSYERFDPRDRPWFVAAAAQPGNEGVWTDPYLFHGNNEPGVTYARPVRHPTTDTLLGVFSVDFAMAPLSRFLSSIHVARHGRAFLVTREGVVVGEPQGRLVHLSADGLSFWRAQDHPDPMLSGAWRAMRQLDDPWAPFEFRIEPGEGHDGHILAVATPFPANTDVPWLVLTTVPRRDLLGHAEDRALEAAMYALLALFVAMIAGTVLSRNVGRSVARLRRVLLQVARFDLHDDDHLRSSIREFDEMGRATLVMKQGLRAFARYVPHQLVRQVLASGRDAEIGADRRELTVLFSDIEGFTSVVEVTPPATVLAALSAYLERMNAAIEAHGGTVVQYIGDGIMAFWGAPEPRSDHAVAACRAALEMQAHAVRLTEAAEGSGDPALPTRIGLDTGEVMVGNIGAPDRFNYGALGDTVNTASRLQDLNKVYRTPIIAGARTVEMARGQILFRPLDRVLLRGKRRAVLVYQVMGIRDEVDEETLAGVAGYTASLEVYFAGRFAEARAGFATVSGRHPDDAPARIMMARCARYEADPPGKDWDGVHVEGSRP